MQIDDATLTLLTRFTLCAGTVKHSVTFPNIRDKSMYHIQLCHLGLFELVNLENVFRRSTLLAGLSGGAAGGFLLSIFDWLVATERARSRSRARFVELSMYRLS